MGCDCQQPLADLPAEPTRTPWWAWVLGGLGVVYVAGAWKMHRYYERHGRAAEEKCAKHKSWAKRDACIERELRGTQP